MPKFTLKFTTTIKGQLTVEADTLDAAFRLGDSYASDTLNYEDLTDGGKCAPDVETECEDGWEANS